MDRFDGFWCFKLEWLGCGCFWGWLSLDSFLLGQQAVHSLRVLLERIECCLDYGFVLALFIGHLSRFFVSFLLLSFFLPHESDLFHELPLLLLVSLESNIDVDLVLFFLRLQMFLDDFLGELLCMEVVQGFLGLSFGFLHVNHLLGLLDSLQVALGKGMDLQLAWLFVFGHQGVCDPFGH